MDTTGKNKRGTLWWGLACLAGGALVTVLGFALSSTAADDNPVLLVGPLLLLAGFGLVAVGAVQRAIRR